MELELITLPVTVLALGNQTGYQHGALQVDATELVALVAGDSRLAAVTVDVARPGDPVRIVHAMDVVEPRAKLAGRGEVFPGFLGPPDTVGSGRTLRLNGMAVVTTAVPPGAAFDTVVSVSEGLIDMSGPGAALSPFSELQLLALNCLPAPGVTGVEFMAAVRRSALRIANHLARVAAGTLVAGAGESTVTGHPGGLDRRVYSLATETARDLPRVAVISQLARTGDLYDTFLYGRSVRGILPTWVHPNEYLDGAVVSGNYRYACQRNPTYFYQNNPVLEQLYRKHGQELLLVGTVVFQGHMETLEEKQLAADYCAKLARTWRADGAVITAEGGGHALMEIMLTCQSCEAAGIKTALVMAEMAGPDGTDNPFVDAVQAADLIISAGNQEERITLPAMDRVIGGDALLETGDDPRETLTIPVRHIYCSTCQLGSSRVAGRAI